jgi:two-component system sensor histidine kinase UhpB
VQEALTNVERHAGASCATVLAAVEDGMLRVEVRDDGKGAQTPRQDRGGSWGIVGMHERARFFGGELTITGKAGEGTSVVLRLPMEQANGE